MTTKILILNGPNLNMLGVRQPAVYGASSLADVETLCRSTAADNGAEIDFRQSNHEGELIDWIQDARGKFDGIVINPGGYSHTSVAIPDALRAVDLPVIEVHISNIHARERYRHHSYVSAVAKGVICGLGAKGYAHAIVSLTNGE